VSRHLRASFPPFFFRALRADHICLHFRLNKLDAKLNQTKQRRQKTGVSLDFGPPLSRSSSTPGDHHSRVISLNSVRNPERKKTNRPQLTLQRPSYVYSTSMFILFNDLGLAVKIGTLA
jgi:hypothetical protein